MTAELKIQCALDIYYCRDMMDEPATDEELLERIIEILEGAE